MSAARRTWVAVPLGTDVPAGTLGAQTGVPTKASPVRPKDAGVGPSSAAHRAANMEYQTVTGEDRKAGYANPATTDGAVKDAGEAVEAKTDGTPAGDLCDICRLEPAVGCPHCKDKVCKLCFDKGSRCRCHSARQRLQGAWSSFERPGDPQRIPAPKVFPPLPGQIRNSGALAAADEAARSGAAAGTARSLTTDPPVRAARRCAAVFPASELMVGPGA